MRDRVVVIGASGFGRECLDVLDAAIRAGADLEVAGVIDDGPSELNLKRLAAREVVHLSTIEEFIAAGDTDQRYVLGIGDPAVRRRLVAEFEAAGFAAVTVVHPAASVGSLSEIGDGVVVCAGVAVSTGVRLGRHVHLNPNATIGHDARLEDFVSINPAAVVSGDVRIGAGTLVGANATVLQGLSVGSGTLIGAGSVVTRDVPGGVVVKGVPGVW